MHHAVENQADRVIVNKTTMTSRMKNFCLDFVQNLFRLREVEVTVEEKGKQTYYTYKKTKRA